MPTVKTQDQDSSLALACLSLCHGTMGGAWAVVVVAVERESDQTGGKRDTLRGGRVQPTHGRPSEWGRVPGQPIPAPSWPYGSTGGTVWRITRGRVSLIRRAVRGLGSGCPRRGHLMPGHLPGRGPVDAGVGGHGAPAY